MGLERRARVMRMAPIARYALLALLAAVMMLPAALAPPMTHDSFWIDRTWSEQFTAALAQGNLYPRWLPLSFGGLGAPVFYYYAPASFYLAGLFGLAGLAAYPALLAAFGAGWFASGAAMYLWLRDRARAPLLGAILYMVLPYHMIDFYGRGALAEFCAFACVPLVALGVETAVRRGRALPLALAYAALIMTHLPSAVIASVLLVAPLALWSTRHEPRRLWHVARGVAGGMGGAALYLAPALTLQRHTSLGSLWSVKFLQPASWSLLHPALWTSTSYVLLFAGLALAVTLAVALTVGRRWSFWAVWTVGVCVVLAGLVPRFWSLPMLSAVQFPWRCLVLAEFGLATSVACAHGRAVAIAVGLAPLLGFSLLMMSPANPLHGESMRPLPLPGRQDVIEYLPPGSVADGRAPRSDLLRQAAAAAQARPGSVFPFPSLRAECADGSMAPLRPDLLARLVVAPPLGCRLSVARLSVEWIGFAVSLLAWMSFGVPWLRRVAAAIRRACRASSGGSRAAA